MIVKGYFAAILASAVLFGTSGFAAGSPPDGTGDNDFGPTTAKMDITLTVSQGCSIDFGSSSTISFTFSSLNSPLTQAGNLTIKCSYGSGGTAKVSLDAGNVNPDDKTSQRWLYYQGKNDKTNRIQMQVYQGGNTETIWGDGNNGTKTYDVSLSDTDAVLTEPFTVELPKQDLTGKPQGEYTNTMTATIAWQPSP